jgi:hypothetical protein
VKEFKPKTTSEYEEAVKHPGKFEGEAAYVPYFWDLYMEGGADRDYGDRLGFDIHDVDKLLFPELKHRRTVELRETDLGFVVEVNKL